MAWEYFGYWVTAGITVAIIVTYIEFVSTGKFELKLNEIPILFIVVVGLADYSGCWDLLYVRKIRK